ncbi:hypothetical protein Tco_0834406, partial [Tanacetum coccineum]
STENIYAQQDIQEDLPTDEVQDKPIETPELQKLDVNDDPVDPININKLDDSHVVEFELDASSAGLSHTKIFAVAVEISVIAESDVIGEPQFTQEEGIQNWMLRVQGMSKAILEDEFFFQVGEDDAGVLDRNVNLVEYLEAMLLMVEQNCGEHLIRRFAGRGNGPDPSDVKIASLKQWIQELEFPQLQQDSPAEEAKTESNVWDDRSEDVNPFSGGNLVFHDDHYDNPFFQEEPIMLVEEESCPVYDTDNEEEESMPVYDTDIEDVIEEEEGFPQATEKVLKFRLGGLRNDDDFNADQYWLDISSEDKLTLSRSSAKTVRKPVLRILQKMITYGLCQRTTWYDKIQKNDLWPLMDEEKKQLLDVNALRELISSNERLIPEEITPSIPRVATPKVIRHTTSDMYDKIGQLEIRININEGMISRQSYHSDIYASVLEHIGAHQGTTLRDPYNPPNYAEEPQQ